MRTTISGRPSRRDVCVSIGALAAGIAVGGAATAAPRWPVPPQQPRIPAEVGNFGYRRVDDYAWMRPKDWLAVLRDPATLDPPIAQAIAAEDRYADAMLAPSVPLQRKLRARAEQLYTLNDTPVEIADHGFLYYTRASEAGGAVYLRRPAAGGPEQVLLDPSVEGRGHKAYSINWTGAHRNADGTLIGWAEDLTGSGIFRIRVREIATGRLIVSDLDDAHGGFAFDPAGGFLYWVGRNANGTANAVWRRDLATGIDVKLHAEDDPSFFIELRPLASGRFVLFRMLNGAQTEAWLIPAGDPAAKPILVQRRTPELRYDVEHWNDRLVILTDTDGAPDQKLMVASVARPDKAHWAPLVPHRAGRFIAAIHPFRDHLVREEWRDALPRLVVMDKHGGERDVSFDEPAYSLTVPPAQPWDAEALAFGYESPRLPRRAQRLALDDGKVSAVSAAVTGFDPAIYVVERLVVTTADGAQVPVTVTRRRDTRIDGRAPLFLYGYGSYGATVETVFRPAALALADEGWVHAIAHVRGGAERGTDWWRQVLRQGKKKSFTDFIACAEGLIARRYAAKGRIVAHGYSAGGLMMGAAYTMRPDLWAGVIAQVPFVDPVNTMDQYETHPLGSTPFPIWGDPRVPADHAYIASYSPYDNLKPAPYPALLATGNVADERVGFFEPLKFATKARALTTAGNPIMVRIAKLGGHVFPEGSVAARDQDAVFGGFAAWAVDRRWGIVPQR